MKKKLAIAVGITSNYVDILANVLVGLKKHNKKFWDDIIVYNDGIKEEDQRHINKIVECKFIKLDTSSMEFLKKIPHEQIKTYSVATFFRFECFNLLKEYERVIWSDVDVLIQGDISELATYATKSGYAATMADSSYRVENNFFELINEYNMFVPMYNAGLFVISDKLHNYKEIVEWCYQKTIEYGKILRWLDQGILNLLIQEFKIDVEEIDLMKFHCHPSSNENLKDARIIHAHGLRKFWNDQEYIKTFPEWQENANEWHSICDKDNSTIKIKDGPLVSVIMSVYSRFDYLDEAIQSILDQTYTNFELIIVVELSDRQNEINELIKSYNDSRIIVINNSSKLGFSNSLNVGIENSKGKYIARMDDDDISLPLRFEKQVEFLEHNLDVGICGTNAEFFMHSNGLWNKKHMSSEEIKVDLLVSNPICHPSVMMRKSMLQEYGLSYNPNYFSEDYELWSRAVEFFPIVNLDEVLLKYRASKKNVTSINGNDSKIHNSVKETMKHQFNDYLGISLNDNELELLQRRKNIVGTIANVDSALKLREQLFKNIIRANNVKKFYETKIIERYFSNYKAKKGRSIKRFIKKVLRPFVLPFYRVLENRIRHIVNQEMNK